MFELTGNSRGVRYFIAANDRNTYTDVCYTPAHVQQAAQQFRLSFTVIECV